MNIDSLITGAILLALITGIVFGICKGRFAYPVKSGFAAAEGRTDTILNYRIDSNTRQRMVSIADAVNAQIDTWERPGGDPAEQAELLVIKTKAKKRILDYKVFLASKRVKTAGGFLHWATGWQFLSLNPFNRIIRSDLGKGDYRVQVIRSPVLEVGGVDLPGRGKDGAGMLTVSVSSEMRNAALFDLERWWTTEQKTDDQVTDRLRAAVNLICCDRDVDDIRRKEFTPKYEQRAAEALFDFGIIPESPLSIIDVSLKAEVQKAEEERGLVETQKQTAEIKSEEVLNVRTNLAEATKRELIAQGEGTAAAAKAVLGAQLEALKAETPDVKRSVLGKTAAGQLPIGVSTVSLGGGEFVTGDIKTGKEDKKGKDSKEDKKGGTE